MAMGSNGKTFKTVVFEESTHAVVRTDPHEPRFLEVVAIFHDASRARNYADIENDQSAEELPKITPKAAPKKETVERTGVESELSGRQSAVLEALRAKADNDNLVEIRAAVLAEAANIPLGSLHSVLQSLEKKQLILTTRPGSARAPAVYKVI